MVYNSRKGFSIEDNSYCLIFGLFEGEKEISGSMQEIDKKINGRAADILNSGEFKGKMYEKTLIHIAGEIPAKRILLLGLGKKNKATHDTIRRVCGDAVRFLRSHSVPSCAMEIENLKEICGSYEIASQAAVEGFQLGLYKFEEYITKESRKVENKPDNLTFLVSNEENLSSVNKGIETGLIIAEGTSKARDLCNHPANIITPTKLGEIAEKIAGENANLSCKVYSRADVEKLGMGALIAIGQGSDEPLKLIELEYKPPKALNKKPIALVGKAITFDAGGISLKPSENMHQMKDDMSGGAAVICILQTASKLKLPVHILGIVPAAENLPSGKAVKPGDIIKTMSGQTIEIQNTDAEGRVILSDGLYFASTHDPEVIIDLATLTAAVLTALGTTTAGMMGNSAELMAKITKASEKTGEKIWELPMWDEYHEPMESDIADLKNIGDKRAGTITAGKFLEDFTGGKDWVHLDIAGTAWSDKTVGYLTKGGTGTAVRLLTQFLRDYIS